MLTACNSGKTAESINKTGDISDDKPEPTVDVRPTEAESNSSDNNEELDQTEEAGQVEETDQTEEAGQVEETDQTVKSDLKGNSTDKFNNDEEIGSNKSEDEDRVTVEDSTYTGTTRAWSKYETKDKGYSFHYPNGWKVTEDDSIIMMENSKSNEQLMMVMLPFEKQQTPQQIATGFIEMIKGDNPNIKATNWRGLTESMDDHVAFDLADTIAADKYLGLGLVVKDMEQSIWFSYFAPESDYYQIRSYSIIEGFIGSIASGNGSRVPINDYTIDVAANIDKDARAFLFILEFALGAPFTKSQEDTILKSLKDGWRHLSAEELVVYDQYQMYVSAVMEADQKELEDFRTALEAAIKEWLEETDLSDPSVKIINNALNEGGKIVIKGEPPLTEMSLQAYSEVIAYSKLLQKDSKASPDKITKKSVESVKKKVKEVWKDLSDEDKEGIAIAPGLWVCLRSQYNFGTEKEKKDIRDSIKRLEENKVTEVKAGDKGDNSSDDSGKPMDMSTHWSLMQVQQQTFNTYMWSRGYYSPGRMW